MFAERCPTICCCSEIDQYLHERYLSGKARKDRWYWNSAPLAEIIDHIIVRYHDRHREQLPELILQATKVERVGSQSGGRAWYSVYSLDGFRLPD